MNFLKTLTTTGTDRILNASSDRRCEAARQEITVRIQVCTRKVSLVENFHAARTKESGSFY